ncbi:hypothetical protein PF011_g29741 [Phytophthora fragariae]|uniref:Uncharacterized protein n=1 Tax=Phytophthora fragariae TaxID=53985 RepID=A0A6A3GX72_9STRA|nr:hypothetical protein PF011_g29741 [Phytophthora fragariae]
MAAAKNDFNLLYSATYDTPWDGSAVSCLCSGCTGTFTLSFRGEATRPLDGSVNTAVTLKAALEELLTTRRVSVVLNEELHYVTPTAYRYHQGLWVKSREHRYPRCTLMI